MAADNPSIAIRPASPDDMPFITEHLEKFLLDDEDVDFHQFVVAVEGDAIVGFGRIRPHREVYELGGVGVVEERRNEGIGKMIIRHLIDIFPSDDVYITTDIPGYFEKLGFRRVEHAPLDLIEKIKRVCEKKCRNGAVVMRYRRG